MGPPSYMRSVVDQNVVMRRMTVYEHINCRVTWRTHSSTCRRIGCERYCRPSHMTEQWIAWSQLVTRVLQQSSDGAQRAKPRKGLSSDLWEPQWWPSPSSQTHSKTTDTFPAIDPHWSRVSSTKATYIYNFMHIYCTHTPIILCWTPRAGMSSQSTFQKLIISRQITNEPRRRKNQQMTQV